jgi:hypothetical protein
MLDKGGIGQWALTVHVAEVDGLVPLDFSALTITGITAPVFKPNGICPITGNIEAISPE